MYDRILVPTDGSDGTRRAVEHAVDLAVHHDAALRTVYVVDTASYTSLPMEGAVEGVSEMLAEEGERAVEAVEELAAASGVPAQGAVLEGTPSREIVRYAGDQECDIIVMGTHGRGGIDRLLLGSVAEAVVRSAEVPVLTVRVDEGS